MCHLSLREEADRQYVLDNDQLVVKETNGLPAASWDADRTKSNQRRAVTNSGN